MPVQISRILHAGYLIHFGGIQIAFDPVFKSPFSGNCHAFPTVEFDQNQIRELNLSAVFISHFHDDHCCLESLNMLHRTTPIYIFCVFDEIFDLIRQLGFRNVFPLKIDQPIQIGDITVTPRRALDEDVDSMFHIQVDSLNILNVVDSWIDPKTLQQLASMNSWDLVMWPFQSMREIEVIAPRQSTPSDGQIPEEWAEQLKALNPRFLIPSSCQFQMESWSWYNKAFFPTSYKSFQNQIRALLPETKVSVLNPSHSIVLTADGAEPSTPLGWVHLIGSQETDYQYDPNLAPPPTSEIAQRFPALTPDQTQVVFQFLTKGIFEKDLKLDPPEDSYFKKPRLWRLSVYDHHGTKTDIFYTLIEGKINPGPGALTQIGWTTEVSLTKLWGALEQGEALTSLYLRVNDFSFETEIEKEIQEIDIVEDPLIRCLFHGNFAAYQKAQLKRLKQSDQLRKD